MKKPNINFWKKLSLSHKISSIGSVILIGSLFLNWFSDIDVYRSGDNYTGLSGPLYFVGINIFILAIVNLVICLGKSAEVGFLRKVSEIELGKYQVGAGFGVMYLLILANSVYFSPQFGLNILSKRSEIGLMVAMLAAVLLCMGGYMNFRKKFELNGEIESNENVAETKAIEQEEKVDQNKTTTPVFGGGLRKPVGSGINAYGIDAKVGAVAAEEISETQKVVNVENEVRQPRNPRVETEAAYNYSERDTRGKTDYERAKMYENLKKVMMKDTLSPEQRRKEREKQIKENAFSANFGKSAAPAKAASASKANSTGTEEAVGNGKKPQMYRMDL